MGCEVTSVRELRRHSEAARYMITVDGREIVVTGIGFGSLWDWRARLWPSGARPRWRMRRAAVRAADGARRRAEQAEQEHAWREGVRADLERARR